jgi:hypothetical protein
VPREILLHGAVGGYYFITCVALVAELQDVLLQKFGVSPTVVAPFRSELESSATIVQPAQRPGVLDDPAPTFTALWSPVTGLVGAMERRVGPPALVVPGGATMGSAWLSQGNACRGGAAPAMLLRRQGTRSPLCDVGLALANQK